LIEKNESNNNQDYSKKSVLLYVLIGFLFLVFCASLVFLGMFIHKKLYGEQRRKKANELDDGYEYESINNDKNIVQDN
jgi:flagellar basal body-associated protein FliL